MASLSFDTQLEYRNSIHFLMRAVSALFLALLLVSCGGGSSSSGTLISASVNSLSFSGYEGVNSVPQSVTVNLPNMPGTLSASASAGWLKLNKVDSARYEVSVSGIGVMAGSYSANASFTYTTAEGVSSTASIPVTYTVGTGLFKPQDVNVTMNLTGTSAALAGGQTIYFTGNAQTVTWSANSSQSWLTLTSTSGVTPSQVTFAIDINKAALLANFEDHNATVTISAPGYTPVGFNVVLSKRLPEITAITPSPITAGQASGIQVSGKGFSQLGNPAAAINMQGLTATSATVINDQQVDMQLTANNPGNYLFNIPNALGIGTSTAQLKVQ
ncbi:MAG: BACON domain-containing protein [Burkholderiales bacterium]|nr:BACON domain-containing protein [Burkholderiales bacterium]